MNDMLSSENVDHLNISSALVDSIEQENLLNDLTTPKGHVDQANSSSCELNDDVKTTKSDHENDQTTRQPIVDDDDNDDDVQDEDDYDVQSDDSIENETSRLTNDESRLINNNSKLDYEPNNQIYDTRDHNHVDDNQCNKEETLASAQNHQSIDDHSSPRDKIEAKQTDEEIQLDVVEEEKEENNLNSNPNTNTKQQLQQPQQKQQQQVNGNMRSQEQAATTNASLVSSTNSLHSSTSSNSFNQNHVIADNVTSLSSQQQQHNSSHANIQQTSTHSISPPQIVSPSTSSSSSSISPASNSLKTTPKVNEKLSPGVAKRITNDSSEVFVEQQHQSAHVNDPDIESSRQQPIINSTSNNNINAKQTNTTNSSKTANSATNNNANIKIQNALEKNMQKLNQSGKKLVPNGKNLTKEEIELFTNSFNQQLQIQQQHQFQQHLFQPQQQQQQPMVNHVKQAPTSTQVKNQHVKNPNPSNRVYQQTGVNNNNNNNKNQHLDSSSFGHQVPASYYLNKSQDYAQFDLNKFKSTNVGPGQAQLVSQPHYQYSQQQQQQQQQQHPYAKVINRSSTEREMTPDSIDNDLENLNDYLKQRRKTSQDESTEKVRRKLNQKPTVTNVKPAMSKPTSTVMNKNMTSKVANQPATNVYRNQQQVISKPRVNQHQQQRQVQPDQQRVNPATIRSNLAKNTNNIVAAKQQQRTKTVVGKSHSTTMPILEEATHAFNDELNGNGVLIRPHSTQQRIRSYSNQQYIVDNNNNSNDDDVAIMQEQELNVSANRRTAGKNYQKNSRYFGEEVDDDREDEQEDNVHYAQDTLVDHDREDDECHLDEAYEQDLIDDEQYEQEEIRPADQYESKGHGDELDDQLDEDEHDLVDEEGDDTNGELIEDDEELDQNNDGEFLDQHENYDDNDQQVFYDQNGQYLPHDDDSNHYMETQLARNSAKRNNTHMHSQPSQHVHRNANVARQNPPASHHPASNRTVRPATSSNNNKMPVSRKLPEPQQSMKNSSRESNVAYEDGDEKKYPKSDSMPSMSSISKQQQIPAKISNAQQSAPQKPQVKPQPQQQTQPINSPSSSTPAAVVNSSNMSSSGSSGTTMTRSATTNCSFGNANNPNGASSHPKKSISDREYDTDEETNKLLDTNGANSTDETNSMEYFAKKDIDTGNHQDKEKLGEVKQSKTKEILIEGVLFRARYLGSTQLVTDGNPTKLTRMLQAQEAVGRIKAPEGESQPSVEVDLFVSTEKIMVLNTDLQEIMMDHSLRSISYIADIGNLVVLMAKRRPMSNNQLASAASSDDHYNLKRQIKMICHVFESDEAQLVAQSIGQAFQVAYMEYLKANGIEDMSIMKDLDYQEVLNQQEIMGNELNMFAKKECQKEVIIPKQKNEMLGLVIVESGWGSMLPTVVVANMMPTGPAARCGNLNIGDQIISINGISMVGLPLSACQTQIKNTKHLTLVRLVVVPCPPVVEVLIKRPDTKYQLGFSVQDGIICSLLRGGIAERGGVRVGHRIIEINNQSVVATSHEKIVSILANSVGELRMKTMPTQMFRLLTGQELPVYI